MWKKKYRFEKIDVDDLVKFKASKNKIYKNQDGKIYIEKDVDLFLKKDYDIWENKSEESISNETTIYFGKVTDSSSPGYLGVQIDANDKRHNFPTGITFYIDRRAVLQFFPAKYIEKLTPRLVLKHLWKELVFREVKTTLCSDLLYAEYKYISDTGFERSIRFSSIEEAYQNIPPEFHKNVLPYYNDYFGFTTDKALRSNDHHYDREVFFSKKCYSELDWSSNPTGDFMIDEKGFNQVNPTADSLICGIVEDGEKGLFFRKWFVCSKEFLTLWTMICDPKDPSLYENNSLIEDEEVSKIVGNWITKSEKKDKKEKRVKSIETLLEELSTASYSIDMSLDIKERKRKHCIYNLERAALYFPNRYKQVAEVVFSKSLLESRSYHSFSEDIEYSPFQKKLIRNLLWAKKVK